MPISWEVAVFPLWGPRAGGGPAETPDSVPHKSSLAVGAVTGRGQREPSTLRCSLQRQVSGRGHLCVSAFPSHTPAATARPLQGFCPHLHKDTNDPRSSSDQLLRAAETLLPLQPSLSLALGPANCLPASLGPSWTLLLGLALALGLASQGRVSLDALLFSSSPSLPTTLPGTETPLWARGSQTLRTAQARACPQGPPCLVGPSTTKRPYNHTPSTCTQHP